MTVTVPAGADSVRVLRVMAADAAAVADLDFDRYSDLELAVDEAAGLLLRSLASEVCCTLTPTPARVEVHLVAREATVDREPDELAVLVLESVTDELDLQLQLPDPSIRLVVAVR